MGGGTEKTTQTSGFQNKDLDALLSQLSKGISSYYSPTGTNYVAPGSNTTGSWADTLSAANNPAFGGGVQGAIESYAKRASGAEIGQDNPAYQAVRNQITDDTLTAVNNSYNNSGLFGSDQNAEAAARGVSSGLANFDVANLNADYNRQAEGARMLTDLFSGSLLPASVRGSVGAAQDANAAAQQDGRLGYLQNLIGLFSGAAGASPTTTTTTAPGTPLWQTLASLAVAAA